jgi:hypothetical protein
MNNLSLFIPTDLTYKIRSFDAHAFGHVSPKLLWQVAAPDIVG